jgi:hypothetical protein
MTQQISSYQARAKKPTCKCRYLPHGLVHGCMNYNTAENGAAASACFQEAVNEHKCQSQCGCRVFHPSFLFLPSDQASETETWRVWWPLRGCALSFSNGMTQSYFADNLLIYVLLSLYRSVQSGCLCYCFQYMGEREICPCIEN